MTALQIAIRTEGGRDIGFGHIRRCLSLAQALVRNGATVRFLCAGSRSLRNEIGALGFVCEPVSQSNSLQLDLEMLDRWRAQVVVIDSYVLREEYSNALRKSGCLVVAIDDLALHPFPVEMVVNGAVNAKQLPYDMLPETLFLLGPQYALLREEFSDPFEVQKRGPELRVLITLGGSDSRHLTENVVNWVFDVIQRAKVDVAVGPLFDKSISLGKLSKRSRNVNIHPWPQSTRNLMIQADIAISGGGQTCYELAATGTPTLAICMAENQRGNLSGLACKGTLIPVGDAGDPDLDTKIRNSLSLLAAEPEVRREMSIHGRQLVDGLGSKRVADAIVALGKVSH